MENESLSLYVSETLVRELPQLWKDTHGKNLTPREIHKIYYLVSSIHLKRVMSGESRFSHVSIYSKDLKQIFQKQYHLIDEICNLPLGKTSVVSRTGYLKGKKVTGYLLHPKFCKDIRVIKVQNPDLKRNSVKVWRRKLKKGFYEDEICDHVRETLLNSGFANSFKVEQVVKVETQGGRENNKDIIDLSNQITTLKFLSKSEDRKDYFRAYRTKNGNRLFHSYSHLPSCFRKFLQIEDQDTTEIDIRSSQPIMMIRILKENEKDSEEYRQELEKYTQSVTQGRFYQDMLDTVNDKIGENYEFTPELYKEFKKEVYHQIFYGSLFNLKEKSFFTVFESMYPNLTKVIKSQKLPKRGGYRGFAISIQSTESKIVLDLVGRNLMERGIRFIPIHDSLIVQRRHTKTVISILRDTIKREIGVTPTLKTERR